MNRTRLMLLAAVAAVPLLAARADAQYRVDDGRALDANPQVGSGGYNGGQIPDSRSLYSNLVNGNRIITGNVTGLRGFSGQVPYSDPREFRGTLGSASFDSFLARSSSSAGYVPPGTPFYGNRLASPPPPGYEPQGFSGALTARPSNLTDLNRNPLSTYITPQLRTNYYDSLESRLQSGQTAGFIQSGPYDTTNGLATLTTASPLLGVRTLRADDLANSDFAGRLAGLRGPLGAGLDPLQLEQMRSELAATMGPARVNPNQLSPGQLSPNSRTNITPNPLTPGPINNEVTQPGTNVAPGQGQNLSRPVNQPFETPQTPNLTRPIEGALNTGPLSNSTFTGQSIENRFTVPPAAQSSQYAELERRLNRYYTDQLKTDEQRNREFLQQLRAREAADHGQGRAPEPDYARISRELVGNRGGSGVATPTTPVARPEPVKIVSLANGIAAKGLADLVRNGEQLVRDGKFMTAINEFDKALQVAPNNRLIELGKVNAELGAGLYGPAAKDLRDAVVHDPVPTMAQFDLRGLVGQNRLEAIVKDLKETAQKQKEDPDLMLLLAWVAYNTGAEQQAGVYLDEAGKRSGGRDEVIRLLRTNWKLPGQESATAATEFALSDILKQFEEGNVANATLTSQSLTGQFRKAILVPGGSQGIVSFKTTLPQGAATGPLSRWLREHSRGATINIKIPATEPSGANK